MKRERILETIKVAGEGANTIEVKLSYHIGGTNYFTYANEERGIYLHVTPFQMDNSRDGYNLRTYRSFSGYKRLVEPMKRYNAKKLHSLVPDQGLIHRMLEKVLNTNNLTLIENESIQ